MSEDEWEHRLKATPTEYDREKLVWIVPLMAEIKNLGQQLLDAGCNPTFTCPDEGESRPYHKKRLSRTDRRRLEKEGKL